MKKLISILEKAEFKLTYIIEGKEVQSPDSKSLMIIKGRR
jgi:hypothetical protein